MHSGQTRGWVFDGSFYSNFNVATSRRFRYHTLSVVPGIDICRNITDNTVVISLWPSWRIICLMRLKCSAVARHFGFRFTLNRLVTRNARALLCFFVIFTYLRHSHGFCGRLRHRTAAVSRRS